MAKKLYGFLVVLFDYLFEKSVSTNDVSMQPPFWVFPGFGDKTLGDEIEDDISLGEAVVFGDVELRS